MACSEPRLTALKIGYKGEIHRIRVDLSQFTLNELHRLFETTFPLQPDTYVVQYRDNEGDCINVSSDSEYIEACRVFLHGADAVKSLRFFALSKTQVAFQENVAEPILKAMERLIETLNATMEKVKREEWARKAQCGMSTTGHAIKSAVADARESFHSAKKSINEIPFEQILKETADNIKNAAEGIGAFAQDLVDEIKGLHVDDEKEQSVEPAVIVDEPCVNEESNNAESNNAESNNADEEVHEHEEISEEIEIMQEHSSENESLVQSSSDSEWEQVAETCSGTTESVSTPPSAEELKWANEIQMVREIFPEADVLRTIDLLEQARGNIHVVINAIAEM